MFAGRQVALEHPDNLDIEIAAFGCLCNFAKEPGNSRMIVRQGGTTAVKDAVAKLIFDEGSFPLSRPCRDLWLTVEHLPQSCPRRLCGSLAHCRSTRRTSMSESQRCAHTFEHAADLLVTAASCPLVLSRRWLRASNSTRRASPCLSLL